VEFWVQYLKFQSYLQLNWWIKAPNKSHPGRIQTNLMIESTIMEETKTSDFINNGGVYQKKYFIAVIAFLCLF
jgi:hypothetical protein